MHYCNLPDWKERFYEALWVTIPQLRGEEPPEEPEGDREPENDA
jgi:hypothetical protein